MTKQEIGSLLNQLRLEEQMTVNEVSAKSGLQASQVKAIEEGEKSYTIDSLIKYAHIFYLTVKLES